MQLTTKMGHIIGADVYEIQIGDRANSNNYISHNFMPHVKRAN